MTLFQHAPQRRSLLISSTAVVFAFVLVACGGNDGDPGAQPTTPRPTLTSPAPTTPPASSTVPTTLPSKIPATTKPKPSASTTGAAGGSTAKLDLTCARRGVDTQGITINTAPGGPSSFQSVYSDGSYYADGESSYDSGYGSSFADDQGFYRMTWVPPANAPTGPVLVRAPTQHGVIDLVYTLVAENGSCS